jgi:hypothetical protein
MPSEPDQLNSQEDTQRPRRHPLHGPAHGANFIRVPNGIAAPRRARRDSCDFIGQSRDFATVEISVIADFGARILPTPPLHPSLAILISCDAAATALCNVGRNAITRVHFPMGTRARRRRALCARAITLSRVHDLRACASSATRRPPRFF